MPNGEDSGRRTLGGGRGQTNGFRIEPFNGPRLGFGCMIGIVRIGENLFDLITLGQGHAEGWGAASTPDDDVISLRVRIR